MNVSEVITISHPAKLKRKQFGEIPQKEIIFCSYRIDIKRCYSYSLGQMLYTLATECIKLIE